MCSPDNPFAARKVLLFDTNHDRRDRRADQLRSRGVEVMCACDSAQARTMWLENSFCLVLVETRDSPEAISFSSQVRSESPKQMLAFFDAGPGYLSATPALPPVIGLESQTAAEFGFRLEQACALLSHPNGFREASLRMLAARYAVHHRRRDRDLNGNC